MKLLLLLCGVLCSGWPWRAVAGAGTVDSLLTELNRALAHKKVYDGQRLNRIAALRSGFASLAVNDNTKLDLGLRLYDEYKAFKYDSAFAYGQKLVRLAARLRSPEKRAVAKLKLAFVLLSPGLLKETFDTLERIDPQWLMVGDRQRHCFLLARTYCDLGAFSQDATYQPAY